MSEENAPLEEEIRRVLGASGFAKEDIDEAIRFFHDIVRHGTQPEVAIKSVYKRYGISAVSPQKKRISEVQGDERSIDVTGRVMHIAKKEIAQNGQKKTVLTGTLSDGSGSIRFTVWETDGVPEVKPGDVLTLNRAYGKVWQGRPELHLGRYSSITKGKDSDIPEEQHGESLKIIDIISKRRTSTVFARVLEAKMEEVEVPDKNGIKVRRPVISGVIADMSGKLKFSYWRPTVALEKGDVVRISGGYLTYWRGIPRLTLDEKDRIEKVSIDFPDVDELDRPRATTLADVFLEGGALDVSIRGIVVDLKENSGLISRCPECRRVVRSGVCTFHQGIKPVDDLRVKGVIDDSTGSCIFVLNKETTEHILGMTVEECKKEFEKKGDPNSIYTHIQRLMLGRPYEVRGDISQDQFGYMMIAAEISPISIDAASEARKLKEEWETEE